MRRNALSEEELLQAYDNKLVVKAEKIAKKNNLFHHVDSLEIAEEYPLMDSPEYRLRVKQVWFTVTQGDYVAVLGSVKRVSRWGFAFNSAYFLASDNSFLDKRSLEADLVAQQISRDKRNFDKTKYLIIRNSLLFHKDEHAKNKRTRMPSITNYDDIAQVVDLVDDGEDFQTIFRALRYKIKNKEDIHTIRDCPEEWIPSLFPSTN